MKSSVLDILSNTELVFFDFDGVIKDSVEIKTQAYVDLFSSFGEKIVKKVINHHNLNGGISRYEKIPYYFSNYVGKTINKKEIEYYSKLYSQKVMDKVIECDWIKGVEDYLRKNTFNQKFILITGTPQEEIESINDSLKLTSVFDAVYGSPNKKDIVIKSELLRNRLDKNKTVVIGDSITDYEAAKKNNILFIYRGNENDRLSNYRPKFSIENFLLN